MSELPTIENITDKVKEYLSTSISIIKLQAIERTSVIGSGLMASIIIGSVWVMFILFFSIGLSYYLSFIIGDNYSGFAIVAGFYLLLAIILLLVRKWVIQDPLRDKIIREILEESNHKTL